MASADIDSSPLSILVLLSDSISVTSPRNTSASALPAGSTSPPTDKGLRTTANDDEIDHHRRLSLAPGIGAGSQFPRRSSGSNPPSPLPSALGRVSQLRPQPATAGADATSKAHPSSKPVIRTSNLDPMAPTPQHLSVHRGSVALPSGSMLGGRSGGRRITSVGDDLIDALRRGGLEVTAVRLAAHLPGILASSFSNSTISQHKSGKAAQQVILCPLGEAPSLPSLSLLMARGTTPSAVCFQQELLDHARKVESDWVAAAVSTIHHIEQLCSSIPECPPKAGQVTPHPVIIPYVAGGALAPSAVQACIGAGAFGVLHPPYDERVATTLKLLVAAGPEGKATTMVKLSSPSAHNLHGFDIGFDDETKVVLTPTALGLGAEHESEKVLSAFAQRSGRTSGQTSRKPSLATAEIETRFASADAASSNLPTLWATSATLADFPSVSHLYDPAAQQNAQDAARRRSVDTGGIALAFDRATKRMVPVPVERVATEEVPDSPRDPVNVVAGDKEQEAADGGNTTQFAEVLGQMYHQTMMSIEVQMSEYDAVSASLSREERERLVEAISTWDFKPHLLSPLDLYRVACLLFESVLHIEGVVELCIGRDQVNRFLFAVRAIYHAPNPYHNYVHAIDVLQATYLFLLAIGVVPPFEYLLALKDDTPAWKRPSEEDLPPAGNGTRLARRILRPQDVLDIMIAAIGHDVGHPGLSNAFMKNAKVPLSVVYDDKSVLENLHCMLIVQLLRKHGFGFLLLQASPTEAEKFPARAAIDTRGFRRVLYSAILATDMALHFAWIPRLKEFGEAMQGDNPVDRDALCEQDRVMLCQALIKCADISNPARPIGVSEHWSTVLLDEWTKQASLEEELALPVSVVAGVDARLQAKGQVGFIDLFANPLFKAAADVIPELKVYTESCENNRSIWQSRLEQLEADAEINNARTAALRTKLVAPVGSSQDERFNTLFPLILPATLVPANSTYTVSDTPSSAIMPQSPQLLGQRASPAVQAVRVVYRDEVHDRSMLARHVLALTGFDPAGGNTRRMSTPDVLLVHSRSS